MDSEATVRRYSRESAAAAEVPERSASPCFLVVPVKGIAVKDFVPVHPGGKEEAPSKPGTQKSAPKVKKACTFDPGVPDVPAVAAIRSSSPEFRRGPRENHDRSRTVLTRPMQFPSEGSLFSESNVFREWSLQRLAGTHGPVRLRAQWSAMSELWKKPRRPHSPLGADAHARSEPAPAVCRDGHERKSPASVSAFRPHRGGFTEEDDTQPCTSFVGISSSTAEHFCERGCASSGCLPGGSSLRQVEERPGSSDSQPQLDRLRPSSCRHQKKRCVRLSSSTRTDEDDVLLARLEDHAACAKLSLSELRGPTGKLRTSDMFVGGGRRGPSVEVAEVVRNAVIWLLVLSGTATIMFGAVGTIVLRTGSVMLIGSALGSALTTAGVLMAIYCTDASSDRNFKRIMNHKYNYT